MSRTSFCALLTVLVITFRLSAVTAQQNPCIGRQDNTFVNDFEHCSAFYTCIRNHPVPGRCPEGFHFDEARQMCDHSWNVVCMLCRDPYEDGTVDPEPEIPQRFLMRNNSQPLQESDPNAILRFPVQYECSKYTLCHNGRGILRECGEGLIFDREVADCVLSATGCEYLCPNNINPENPAFVADPEDCARYYVCHRRVRSPEMPFSCPGELLFNRQTGGCDLPHNVVCDAPAIPDVTKCPPAGVAYIPSPDSCNEYKICINGAVVGEQNTCAGNTIFDIINRRCEQQGMCHNPAENCPENQNCIDTTE